MEIVYLVVAICMSGMLGWLIARSRFLAEQRDATTALLVEQQATKAQLLQIVGLRDEIERERKKVLDLTNALASVEADYRNLEEKLDERRAEMIEVQKTFSLQFKNLANEIFEEKSRKFTEQNKANIGDLLKPLGEKIVEFEKRVDDTHKDTISRNSALREQLENLQKLNVQMAQDAENLTRALKGDSQAQGAWGEFILESILEKSGLERDREYSVQESFNTPEGRLRPDVIVRLPENKHVVIDSKVSLTAYNNFVNSETQEEKALALKAHLLSIRQHMKSLSDKNYQRISENGLEFVILFIPIEPAYILAIQSEKTLYEEALERRVMFVSPTLLIPFLQLIRNVWKQEQQNRNTQEIVRHATALYEKFKGFTDDLIDLGTQIKKSQHAYEGAMNKLATGNGNLVRRVEEFKKMGINPDKSIDQRLLDKSADQGALFE